TVARLQSAFDLVPAHRVVRSSIVTQPISASYVSRQDPNLWVLDKVNGQGHGTRGPPASPLPRPRAPLPNRVRGRPGVLDRGARGSRQPVASAPTLAPRPRSDPVAPSPGRGQSALRSVRADRLAVLRAVRVLRSGDRDLGGGADRGRVCRRRPVPHLVRRLPAARVPSRDRAVDRRARPGGVQLPPPPAHPGRGGDGPL